MTTQASLVARRASFIVALAFASGAVFHVIAGIWSGVGAPSPTWRHVVFVGVNGFFAAGFGLAAWRGIAPRWFALPVLVLVAQQIYSHGQDFLRARAIGELDVQSLVVLLFLPVVVLIAYRLIVTRPSEGSR